MRIETVDPRDPEGGALRDAAEIIKAGGIVVFPTETVYGVAANVFDEEAVEKVFVAKGRSRGKPLPVFVSERDQLETVVRHVPALALPLIERFWPGPLTLVMDARPTVPLAVTAASGTVGVRLPDHPVALGIMRLAGVPLACTSANPSGGQSPASAKALSPDFLERVDLVLDGGRTAVGIESTVVDVTGEAPRLVRVGAVDAAQIERVLGLRLQR